MTSDIVLGAVFVAAATLSLASSWVLIARIERVGARFGLSEALLGMVAALAGDAPEITAAISALAAHDTRIGAGVVLGSNVFNLAALLGLSAVVAGRVALHRRVIEMNGAIGVWIAGACLLVVLGVLAPTAGLLVVAIVVAPYLWLLGIRHERLAHSRLPRTWTRWLIEAISEEELELESAIHPSRGGGRDALLAALATLVVVGASVAMERSASQLGARHAVPEIVTGGLVLAAVTSLPNAVAAVYLAARGRGAAVLSTALNSNALNVILGLIVPAAIVGLDGRSGQTAFVAGSYLALTVLALMLAYFDRGLRRPHGAIVIGAYLAFVTAVLLMDG
ncbi:MAG TPA: hypothetical protein VHS55_05520 [Solirubrobacteraceae bacterium]|jgi:cation:H+ antiporter|nr:hypothetical protein [Solirubrobacteraceae bacterium]